MAITLKLLRGEVNNINYQGVTYMMQQVNKKLIKMYILEAKSLGNLSDLDKGQIVML